MPRELITGYNADVATTEETVGELGAAYTYMGSASVVSVSSGSANDAAAGTGARSVQVEGIDANGALKRETVDPNGQTGNNTTTVFSRILRARVLTAGSGGVNAGIVYVGTGTITTGVPANIFAQMTIGQNRTHAALYTIPTGYIGYLDWLEARSVTASIVATLRLIVRPSSGAFETVRRMRLLAGGDRWMFDGYRLLAGDDLEIRAAAASSTVDLDVAASIRLDPQ